MQKLVFLQRLPHTGKHVRMLHDRHRAAQLGLYMFRGPVSKENGDDVGVFSRP